jgi:hypothetical protein
MNKILMASAQLLQPQSVTNLQLDSSPMALEDFPRPVSDNGNGIHWIPTVGQSPDVVDHYVAKAKEMGMKWVVFLNEGVNIGQNDYLVEQLTRAGIEPVMRIYTPGVVPIEGDIQELVEHYSDLGVHYYQLYNEPNLMVETGGKSPNVSEFLDHWIPAAKEVLKAGGLPGLSPLSPMGEMDDRQYLTQMLEGVKSRGQVSLLDKAWLGLHNYTGALPLSDPDGFLRFRQYDQIVRQQLGRSMPVIGTEGGTHVSEAVSEEQQISMVTGAYDYMRRQREPYNFAFTYWIIANGHDPAWEEHALFRSDGPTSLASALMAGSAGGGT